MRRPAVWGKATHLSLEGFQRLFAVVSGVLSREIGPLFRQLLLGEDRRHGADWFTGAAIDTSLGIDVELLGRIESIILLGGMNTVDGANFYTSGILAPDARLNIYIGHVSLLLLKPSRRQLAPCAGSLQIDCYKISSSF